MHQGSHHNSSQRSRDGYVFHRTIILYGAALFMASMWLLEFQHKLPYLSRRFFSFWDYFFYSFAHYFSLWQDYGITIYLYFFKRAFATITFTLLYTVLLWKRARFFIPFFLFGVAFVMFLESVIRMLAYYFLFWCVVRFVIFCVERALASVHRYFGLALVYIISSFSLLVFTGAIIYGDQLDPWALKFHYENVVSSYVKLLVQNIEI